MTFSTTTNKKHCASPQRRLKEYVLEIEQKFSATK